MRALEVERLCKSYRGFIAVNEVSFAVDAGEMVALIGPNGAGKTTCFNMIGGQLAPSSGRVTILGQGAEGLPPHRIARLGVGRTFQIAAGFSSMTLAENLQVALIAHNAEIWSSINWAARRRRDEALSRLDEVGLADQAERMCAEIAYGDVKRLELAVALANEPRLLLMDEPTAGMAPSERRALMALTASLTRQRQIGVLFTEHDMDAVFGHADRLIVLNRGEILAEGAPDAVRGREDVRTIYLGAGAAHETHR